MNIRQDPFKTESARIDTAANMYVDLTNTCGEYESKVNQLMTEAKQAQDALQASSSRMGVESQARPSLDGKQISLITRWSNSLTTTNILRELKKLMMRSNRCKWQLSRPAARTKGQEHREVEWGLVSRSPPINL